MTKSNVKVNEVTNELKGLMRPGINGVRDGLHVLHFEIESEKEALYMRELKEYKVTIVIPKVMAEGEDEAISYALADLPEMVGDGEVIIKIEEEAK